jgi:hypothetical protein
VPIHPQPFLSAAAEGQTLVFAGARFSAGGGRVKARIDRHLFVLVLLVFATGAYLLGAWRGSRAADPAQRRRLRRSALLGALVVAACILLFAIVPSREQAYALVGFLAAVAVLMVRAWRRSSRAVRPFLALFMSTPALLAISAFLTGTAGLMIEIAAFAVPIVGATLLRRRGRSSSG